MDHRMNKPIDLSSLRATQFPNGSVNMPPTEVSGAAPTHPEFTDTIAFRSPVIPVNRQQLAQQRVLAPSAGGTAGNAYKMLRAQVLHRLDKLNANTLAILSPTEGAGKTLTAINLAIAIAAESGRTALLVDLDLRNPSIHHRLGLTPELGIEECLATRHCIQDAMIKLQGYERLTVLPARQRLDSSSELLSSEHCAALIAELRSRYANRIIIFDLPPVLQADDALSFSRLVQAGLMVTCEGRTRREDVPRAINLLSDLTIVGTVLNGSREQQQLYY